MKNKEISKKIYNQRVINKINNKIKLLGISSKLTTEKFLIIRLTTTIIIFLFILINYKYGYILSIIVSIIYYFLLEKIVLDSKIKKRRKKLDIEAIYFFEVLGVCVSITLTECFVTVAMWYILKKKDIVFWGW